MQLGWLWRGLRTGVLTTRYPAGPERMPDAWRGTVTLDDERCRPADGAPCVRVCLPGALSRAGSEEGDVRLLLDRLACIACGRCVEACPQDALRLTADFELAVRGGSPRLHADLGGEP